MRWFRLLVGVCAIAIVTPPTDARPPKGPYESFRIRTDNVPQAEIAGWVLPAANRPRGTMFLLHGWNNDKHRVVGWEWVRDREDWNLVMFDFREHGESTRSAELSTLGYHEIWDVKAVVDYAEGKGLAKPYVIYGRSLGAAVGLRWASMDRRIDGVFAVSPFKNAYLASQQLTASRLRMDFLPSPFALHNGFRRMLEEVDIPRAVAARNDLRIWVLIGERDFFPESDQREILAASASPPELKRLVVAPGHDHRTVWRWPGDAQRPSHDAYLREFLQVSERGPRRAELAWIVGISAGFGVALVALAVFVRRSRRRGGDTPEPTLKDPIPA